MKFHSQDKQDLFLETYVFKGLRKGVFMDIGAHDGITINNTLFFSQQRDWSGVNVEPLPTVYKQLVINRPNDININCAVCNYNGTAPFLSNSGYTEMLSGLKTYYDPRHTTFKYGKCHHERSYRYYYRDYKDNRNDLR